MPLSAADASRNTALGDTAPPRIYRGRRIRILPPAVSPARASPRFRQAAQPVPHFSADVIRSSDVSPGQPSSESGRRPEESPKAQQVCLPSANLSHSRRPASYATRSGTALPLTLNHPRRFSANEAPKRPVSVAISPSVAECRSSAGVCEVGCAAHGDQLSEARATFARRSASDG